MTRSLAAVMAVLLATAPTTSWADDSLATFLTKAAHHINSVAPYRVTRNDITASIVGASASGKVFTFFVKMHDTDCRDLPPGYYEGPRRAKMLARLCAKEPPGRIYSRGGTIRQIWRDQNDRILMVLAANLQTCNATQ